MSEWHEDESFWTDLFPFIFSAERLGCADEELDGIFEIVPFTGRSVLDLVHPDDIALALASLDTIVTKQVGDLIPIRVRTSRGTWIYLEIRGSTVMFRDEPLIALIEGFGQLCVRPQRSAG